MMMKLFADGADFDGIVKASNDTKIHGFTTNPTLMRAAGITDYEKFAHKILEELSTHRPETSISLEVFADDLTEMGKQAIKIHEWSLAYDYPIYVKIPVTTTDGTSTAPLYKDLSNEGVSCNITAVFTEKQTIEILENINHFVPGIVSIFAGRIADTGISAVDTVRNCIRAFDKYKNNNTKIEFLWASCREPYNYVEAEKAGCDIITMPLSMISKMNEGFGKNLSRFSLETVKMFYDDAKKSEYTL